MFFSSRVRERRPNITRTLTLAPTQAKEPSRVLEKLRKHVLSTSKSNHIWYLIGYDSWGDNIANYTGSFSQLLYVAVCIQYTEVRELRRRPRDGGERVALISSLGRGARTMQNTACHICAVHTLWRWRRCRTTRSRFNSCFLFNKYYEIVHVHGTDVLNEETKNVVHHAHKTDSGVRATLRRPGGLPCCR